MSRYRTIVADPPWDYGKDAGRWPMLPSGSKEIVHKSIPYDAMALAFQNFFDVWRLPTFRF